MKMHFRKASLISACLLGAQDVELGRGSEAGLGEGRPSPGFHREGRGWPGPSALWAVTRSRLSRAAAPWAV